MTPRGAASRTLASRVTTTRLLFAFLAAIRATPAIGSCIGGAGASPAPAPVASSEPPLYDVADEIYTIDRAGTAYFSFQGNDDGSARAKRELRYSRNLWNDCAQLQVRLPFITRYPATPNSYAPKVNPYSGFGNAELRYSYTIVSKTFDRWLEVGAAFPTASNGAATPQTVLKLLYATKWKWAGGSVAYVNQYDQTVIGPPGAGYTSFYEGKLTFPNYSFVDSPNLKGLKISAIYSYRVLFNDGGLDQSAIGGIINGNINDVALNFVDRWGLGGHGPWKYKVEASAVTRF
jgi:hypothetical protein